MTKKTENRNPDENTQLDSNRFVNDKALTKDMPSDRSRPAVEIRNPSDATKEQIERVNDSQIASRRYENMTDAGLKKELKDREVTFKDDWSREQLVEALERNPVDTVELKDKPDASYVDPNNHPETKQEAQARAKV